MQTREPTIKANQPNQQPNQQIAKQLASWPIKPTALPMYFASKQSLAPNRLAEREKPEANAWYVKACSSLAHNICNDNVITAQSLGLSVPPRSIWKLIYRKQEHK
jgi:hypothetical protein